MRITFDPAKRQRTLAARGMDFEDAAEVFAGPTLEVEDSARTMAKPASIASAICTTAWS
jgi:uncharacterized DUF497 family protein